MASRSTTKRTILIFAVVGMLSKDSSEDQQAGLLGLFSSDVYKGLDAKTFAIPLPNDSKMKRFACPKPYGDFPDSSDCQYFYMCTEGSSRYLKCLPGYAFDSSKGYCCPKSTVLSCPTQKTNNSAELSEDFCPLDGAYADPKNCTKYHICTDQKRFQLKCPISTKFDKYSKVCMPVEQAECQGTSNSNKKLYWSFFLARRPNELLRTEEYKTSFVAYH